MEARIDEARKIIRTSERKAFAWGFLPLPVVDVAAVTVVQLGMIRKLAELYGVRYREGEARSILTALLGSLLPVQFGTMVARSAIKKIPGLGTLLGIASLPTLLGGATRIVGKLFAQHFENGGSMADFDLDLDEVLRDAADDEPARASDGADDLTRIEGIGPKICSVLHGAEVRTFEQLANASVAQLEKILSDAGSRFRMHKPASWPAQARLAAEGRWSELDELNRD